MRTRKRLAGFLAGLVVLWAGFVGVGNVIGQSPADSVQSARMPADYQLPWQSVNSGGTSAQNTNYRLDGTVGQAGIGSSASENYQMGSGYWYGISACNCGLWGDVSNDNAVNPVDVVKMVNFVYKSNDTRVQPPNCPRQAGDVNCDNAVNPVDVVKYVNYVYKGQTSAFCPSPCS